MEDYKKKFEQAQSKSEKDLQITPDEAEKFKKAFDDPEFCRLMAGKNIGLIN